MRLLRPALIAAVAISIASPARADPAQAKALFDEGKALFAEGRFGDACKKLEASFDLQPLSGTSGLLGACYEKIGRLASAWSAYRDAASIAERQGNAERAKVSRDNADALLPRLARITIDATAVLSVAGAEVHIDGVVQPRDALSSEIPVDAGPHVISATAIDHRKQDKTIDIADGEKQTVVLDTLIEDPTDRLAAEAAARERRHKARRRKLLGFGLIGAGGVSLAVATTLGVLARSQWNDAKAAGCTDDGNCPTSTAADLVDAAASKADLATILGGAGIAIAAAGIAVYLTAPSDRADDRPRVAPMLGTGTVGAIVSGGF